MQGISEGTSGIGARLNDPTSSYTAAVMGAYCYEEDSWNIAYRVIHETNYNTTNPSYNAAELEDFLNNTVYNQAVTNFEVTKLPDMTVHFDLNNDDELDVEKLLGWITDEMQVIINNCDDPSYEKIIFIVDHPSKANVMGLSSLNQKYGFVFPDGSPDDDEERTTAHELGHALGLDDCELYGSALNIMKQGIAPKWELYKDQWIYIQGKK